MSKRTKGKTTLIVKETPRMILVTHTVAMIVKADPDMDMKDQLAELEANCEAVSYYAFSEGSYTQDTECTIEHFAESVKVVPIIP